VVGASADLDDPLVPAQLADQAIERARQEYDIAVGDGLDLLDDRVPVTIALREGRK
jgi:hypothetical protein